MLGNRIRGDIDDLIFQSSWKLSAASKLDEPEVRFREFHELISVEDFLTEPTAEFCLDQVCKTLVVDLTAQHGTPWNDVAGHPSFCIWNGETEGYELNSGLMSTYLPLRRRWNCRLGDQMQKLSSKGFSHD